MPLKVLGTWSVAGLLLAIAARPALPQGGVPAPGTVPGGQITQQPKLKPGVKDVLNPAPLGAKAPFSGGVGPTIQKFSRNASACPYPDPRALILRYRAGPAPDGTPVARVQIWRNLAGSAGALAYSSTKSEGTVGDSGARADTSAYVLQVTDQRNRSLSRRLSFQYKDPRGLQRNIRPARLRVSYDSTRRDYAYELDFSVHALDIRSLEVTLVAWDDRQTERARVAGIRPELRGYSLPTGYIAGTRELQARFRAAIDITRNYRWSAELGTQVAPPRVCSGDVRMPVLSAELTQRGTPAAPPPVGAVTRGSGTSGCPGEGEACTTRPADCAGREASFQVAGRKVCERGTAVCRAEPQRDYCTACGGVCGPCVTESCSLSLPCPPGSICGYERTATGTQMRCRSLTVPETSPRNHVCWLPSELIYEPKEGHLAYALYCASR